MPKRETIDIEVRFAAPGDDGTVEGTAVTFGTTDSYGTQFARSAFSGLEGRKIPMLWSHDPADVIGHWSGFSADAGGLHVRGRLNLDVARAREVRAMLQAGDIAGLSIGFSTIEAKAMPGGLRRVLKADLHEISLVAMPAVPGAKVTAIRNGRRGAAAELAQAARAAARAMGQRSRRPPGRAKKGNSQ